MRAFPRRAARTLLWVVALGGGIWAGLALALHLDGAGRIAALAALAGALFAALMLHRRNLALGWAVLAVTALAVGIWYQGIAPRQDRDWAPDVARGVEARLRADGDIAALRNIRDFDWTTPDSARETWRTGVYDLTALETVDMFISTWGNPAIAHLLVSFGFADGDHVVFSVEIRREAGEAFSSVAGFFRRFELVLIAATERDIVRLRTSIRKENVSLYRLDVTPAQRRDMFLAYVDLAQRLERAPVFYNTLTANCTTVVYALAKSVYPDLPLDWRILVSGHLPEYVASLGILGASPANGPISQKAQTLSGNADFSDAVRQ